MTSGSHATASVEEKPVPIAPLVSAGPATVACPNCGAQVREEFCGKCGQRRGHVHQPLRQIISEFLEELVHWDSRILRSVGPLFTQPGFLTAEHWRGRRVSYMRPFQLYLSAAFVFFLVAGLGQRNVAYEAPRTPEEVEASVRAQEQQDHELRARFKLPEPDPKDLTYRAIARLRRNTARQTNDGLGAGFRAALLDEMPKAMFLLLPLLALLLRIFDLNSGRYFAESFVFALHLHAFLFFLLAALWRFPAWAFWIGCSVGAGYSLLALRRAYGWSWLRTVSSWAVIAPTYLACLFSAVIGVMLAHAWVS